MPRRTPSSQNTGKAWGADLALKAYLSTLIGAEEKLVLHGGGNCSVKTTFTNILAEEIAAILVKASGYHMAVLGPEGFTPLDLGIFADSETCRNSVMIRCFMNSALICLRPGGLSLDRNTGPCLHTGQVHRPHSRGCDPDSDESERRREAGPGGAGRRNSGPAVYQARIQTGPGCRGRVRSQSGLQGNGLDAPRFGELGRYRPRLL